MQAMCSNATGFTVTASSCMVISGDRHGYIRGQTSYIRGQTCRQCAVMQLDVTVQWQPPAAWLYQGTDTVIPGDRHGYIRGQTCRQCAVMQLDVGVFTVTASSCTVISGDRHSYIRGQTRLYQGTNTVISGDRHGYIRGQTCRQCAVMQLDVGVCTVTASSCPSGWTVFQNSCYLFVDENVPWTAAEVRAQKSELAAY